MLPISNVVQSHFVSCGSFELSKLFSTKCGEGKGMGCDFHKLDFKQRLVPRYLLNFSRKICYQNHLLKAVASPNVSIVHIAEKVATYRFWTENGGQLKILVKKKDDKYLLCVEVVSLQPYEGETGLIMSWGLFSSDSKTFMPLEEFNGNSTVETPFVKDSRARLGAELEFDASLAPFYVSILLKSKMGFNGKPFTIRSHRKTNFVVPVGFGSGRPFPMGLSFCGDGSINFSFFSRNVENVVLCLFEDDTVGKPSLEIDLDPYVNRTGAIWHVQLDGSLPFVSYGYRCKNGTRNNENFVLLDPYAKVIKDFGSGLPRKCFTRICQESAFDWSDDIRPNIPMEKLIVYRLDVGRFTKDKSSKLSTDIAGSFSGVSEKIYHFKDLGVNAVLLEPVFPFDEQKGPYFPWHFFSPRCLNGDSRIVAKSIKDMVKTLHASGIEVLLDVVFTHTSEVAPLTEVDTTSYYRENTSLNCNHPIVSQMILESLRHWAIEYHIDGFVFINASSLTKGTQGELLSRPPLIEDIAFDPLLSKVKIIADSWDPHDTETKDMKFPHWKRWGELNSKFSTDVRNFLRGQGPISNLATRLCGSGDLFLAGRGPAFSFNYITRNLGFTLVDLVSFSSIEVATELSWNCGEEGPTNKTTVLETRLKQIRNFFFILFISLGVPVINMGDECGQSTGGSLKYSDQKSLDWNALKYGFGIQVTEFISFLSSLKMRRSDLLQSKTFLKEENIKWRGADQTAPLWDDMTCKFLALTLKVDKESTLVSDSSFGYGDLFIAFNSADCSQEVTLPESEEDVVWDCLVDTALPYPAFFTSTGVPVKDGVLTYEMKSHSCVLFEARRIAI